MTNDQNHAIVKALEGIDRNLKRIADASEAFLQLGLAALEFQVVTAKANEPAVSKLPVIVSAEEQIAKVLKEQKETFLRRQGKSDG